MLFKVALLKNSSRFFRPLAHL